MTRDYQREYELRKARGTKEPFDRISLTLPKQTNEDFTAKVELEGVTKSAKIKELIEKYTYGDESK